MKSQTETFSGVLDRIERQQEKIARQRNLIEQLVRACEKILPQIYRAQGDYQEARYIDTDELGEALSIAKEQKEKK